MAGRNDSGGPSTLRTQHSQDPGPGLPGGTREGPEAHDGGHTNEGLA
jgi:hypothetical protein